MTDDASDVVLALPERVVPPRHARSTLILASIDSVKRNGRFDDYASALPPAHKEELIGAIAATWLPLAAARAHYAACDALGLVPEQHYQSGRATFDGARSTLLGTAVRMARGAGVTPWNAMPLLQRFWERAFDGGAIGVVRAGPKDANVTVVQCPLVSSPYFRNGLRGLFAALIELFCARAYVTERKPPMNDSAWIRAQWA